MSNTRTVTDDERVGLFQMGYTNALCEVAEHFINVNQPTVAEHILGIFFVTREKAAAALGFNIGFKSLTFDNLDRAGFWYESKKPEVF